MNALSITTLSQPCLGTTMPFLNDERGFAEQIVPIPSSRLIMICHGGHHASFWCALLEHGLMVQNSLVIVLPSKKGKNLK